MVGHFHGEIYFRGDKFSWKQQILNLGVVFRGFGPEFDESKIKDGSWEFRSKDKNNMGKISKCTRVKALN